MKEEIRCKNCKEGKELQVRLKNYPEDFEMYQCEVCNSVWEREQEERQIKDIRLHQARNSRGSTIQVNYGNGWEKIKIQIEE